MLNVGAGDLEFRFDRGNRDEVEKAKRVIQDMLKRGYVIFAEVNDMLHKVIAFDATAERYIIADGVPDSDQEESIPPPELPEPGPEPIPIPARKRGRPKGSKTRSVAMDSVKATAVAPTAGG